MSKQKKEEILIAARDLFNQFGYNAVSMRHIADALGISVGNLTYHYKKKEQLIEAVVRYKHKDYKKIPPPCNLNELNCLLLNIIDIRSSNAYYFNHYFELSLISDEVYDLQMMTLTDLKEALRHGFDHMLKQDLLIDTLEVHQLNSLVEAIISLIVYTPVNTIGQKSKTMLNSTLTCVWDIIYMYLSDQGKKICQPNYFIK